MPLSKEFDDMSQIWLNGSPLNRATQLEDSLDRGLLYGDGFFTTMLVVEGQVVNIDGHIDRLMTSAERLQFSGVNTELILLELVEFMASVSNWPPFSVIKILITRGLGGKGYQPAEVSAPNIYLQLLPFPQAENSFDLIENALEIPPAWQIFPQKLTISSVFLGHQPLLAGIKHLNRLENVLARQALLGTAFDEAIMLDGEGNCISGTQSNLCMIKGRVITTPALNSAGVSGTALQTLKGLIPSLEYELRIEPITLADLQPAEELFLCNALRGVMPVSQFEQQVLPMEKSLVLAQHWADWSRQHLTSAEVLRHSIQQQRI